MKTYIVLGCKPWNKVEFHRQRSRLPGRWIYIDRPGKLTSTLVKRLRPEKLFFIHWSWKVPEYIVGRQECVCFHMTDVPYGRGGSPLQNLIVRGHRATKLTALRMTESFDAGPVYMKRPLSLAGTALEIYERATKLSFGMIREIVRRNPAPRPQKGRAVRFRRRKPEESRILGNLPINKLYDFIRMLDAPTYPPAYADAGNLRFEFRAARIVKNDLTATVRARKRGRNEK